MNDRPELASEEVLRAAALAVGWADGSPLLFGGDLNLRPARARDAFDRLERRFGLAPATASARTPRSLGHAALLSPGPPWATRRPAGLFHLEGRDDG